MLIGPAPALFIAITVILYLDTLLFNPLILYEVLVTIAVPPLLCGGGIIVTLYETSPHVILGSFHVISRDVIHIFDAFLMELT